MATLTELERRRDGRRALWLQGAGLLLTCAAVGGLAGWLWAVLLAGVLLFVAGVLREAGWL